MKSNIICITRQFLGPQVFPRQHFSIALFLQLVICLRDAQRIARTFPTVKMSRGGLIDIVGQVPSADISGYASCIRMQALLARLMLFPLFAAASRECCT